MREFNNCLTGGNAHLKSFPGATAKRLNHYALPTLTEDQPDTIIIHVGVNDLSSKSFENQDSINTGRVCQDVIDIGKTCTLLSRIIIFYRPKFFFDPRTSVENIFILKEFIV